MSPRASLCCRALQRRILPSGDSLWISDSQLANAFERYCHVSKTWQRHVSSVPGPLESQRRLGKRRMGALNMMHTPPSPPPWGLLLPNDLSQWTWEPPTLRSGRSEGYFGTSSNSGWFDRMLSHLEATLLPDDAVGPEAIPPPDRLCRDAQLRRDIDAFCQLAEHAIVDQLASEADRITAKFRHAVFLGEVSPQHVLPMTARIWGALGPRIGGTPLGDCLCLSLYAEIVAAISNSKVFPLGLLEPRFWKTLLEGMSKLPVNDSLCQLFQHVMCIIPKAHINRVSDSVISVVQSIISSYHGPPSALEISLQDAEPGHIRRVRTLSRALARLSSRKHRHLLDAANMSILSQRHMSSATCWHELRGTWLQVLAQLPRVDQDFVFDTAALFSDVSRDTIPLTDTDLCSLLLFHWASHGHLEPSSQVLEGYQKIREVIGGHLNLGDAQVALASLFVALFHNHPKRKRKEMAGLMTSTWRLLAKLNQTGAVVDSLSTFAKYRRVPLPLLELLAYTCNDHRAALGLYTLYTKRLQKRGGRDFSPVVWNKFVTATLNDPYLSADTLWQVLDIGPQFQKKNTGPLRDKLVHHRGIYGAQRARVVEKMAEALSHDGAPSHWSPRMVFRHVAQCVRFLEAVNCRPSPDVLRSLYRVVARDLVQGRPGRTTRLMYFLRVVDRHYGRELAVKCSTALQGWRERLAHNDSGMR